MEIFEGLVKRLENHPIMRDLRRQDREAMTAERSRITAERAKILAARDKVRPTLVRARDEAAAAVASARATLRKLADRLAEAELALTNADYVAERACSRIDRKLRETASPAIAAFIASLDDVISKVQRDPPIVMVDAVLNYGDPPQPIGSNYAALGRWILRGVEVRRKAEALALEAQDEMQLEERFAALREELGAVPTVSDAETRDPSLAVALQKKLGRLAAAAQ